MRDRSIKLKFELDKNDVLRTFGKDNGTNFDNIYLIDEINQRLEKMYCELHYCKKYMYELAHINRIKAAITIYQEDGDDYREVDCRSFELIDIGYPDKAFSFKDKYPDWCGKGIQEHLMESETQ